MKHTICTAAVTALLVAALVSCNGDPQSSADLDHLPDSARDLQGKPDNPDQQTSLLSFPLPERIELGGKGSSVQVADFDGDRYLDMVAIVALEGESADPYSFAVVVAWGAEVDPFAQLTEIRMGLIPDRVADLRDSSSEVIQVVDGDGDGWPDILTSQGWLSSEGTREFFLHKFTDAAVQTLLPVAAVELAGELVAVRGTLSGKVERCTFQGSCAPLGGQDWECPENTRCVIEDLAVGDFDHDGEPDILAGGPALSAPFLPASRLWASASQWQTPITIEYLHTVDYEVGDINGDGFSDLVAQWREFISDFPSKTDIWISDPASATMFRRTQTIYNNDNHTDNAALADANGDGCLDLMMIGVDKMQVAVRLGAPEGDGCAEFLGPHDPSKETDARWGQIPAIDSIGIQQRDINGDGVFEWVLRSGWGWMHVMAVPPPQELAFTEL